MKNKIAALTFAFTLSFLSACNQQEPVAPPTDLSSYKRDAKPMYKIIIIDSCEYIFGWDNGVYNGGYFMTHKGDCHNPIHRRILKVDTVEYKLVKDRK